MEMGWSRGITIGHGSSATVYLAVSPCSSDVIAAVKSAELSLSNSEQQLQLQREQRILSSLSSPYIVTYKGCNITKEHNKFLLNLFMEYMPFGTLSEVTRRGGYGRLHEPTIAHYTRQILRGLDYLHENGIVHCDIKGSNILVCENGVKIGDFGCAKRVTDDTDTDPFPGRIAGTPMFMSPEVARGEEQMYPSDIWALGCTIIEMATGLAPWPNVDDPVTVLYRLAYSNVVPEIPSFLSEQGKDFLEKCFKRDPKERWSCSQLLKHPFVVELNSSLKEIQEFNSSSPTSILEQGFWSSVEDSECFSKSKTCFENSNSSSVGRIKRLALCSRDPNWRWDDENWVTIRRNDDEGASTSDVLEKNDVSCRISGYFCEDCDYRDINVVVNNSLNFERGVVRMLPPSTLDFL